MLNEFDTLFKQEINNPNSENICIKYKNHLYIGKFNVFITGWGKAKNDNSIIEGIFNTFDSLEQGEITFENGNKYKGQIANLKMHGEGIIQEKDNNFEGQFWMGTKDGIFKETKQGNTIYHHIEKNDIQGSHKDMSSFLTIKQQMTQRYSDWKASNQANLGKTFKNEKMELENFQRTDRIEHQLTPSGIDHSKLIEDTQPKPNVEQIPGARRLQFQDGEYIGQIQQSKKHGYGLMKYKSGNVYEGDWKEDLPNGKGTMMFSANEYGIQTYNGYWENGQKNGYGVQSYVSGDTFIGFWKENKKFGMGIHYFKDGSRHFGEFNNNLSEGYGITIQSNGSTYIGNLQGSTFSGFGVSLEQNGNKYVGEWLNNQCHGNGMQFYPDGDHYEGEWKYNKRNGKGIYYDKYGRRQEGQWKNNELNGFGKKEFERGRYEGQFQNGLRHGHGKMVLKSRKIKEGIWENDQFIREL